MLTAGELGYILVLGHGLFYTYDFWQEWSKWAWVQTSVRANPLLIFSSSEHTKSGPRKGLNQDSMSYALAVGLGSNLIWDQSSVIVAFKCHLSINYCSFH